MIPPFTLGTAAAVVLALIGVGYFINGLRHGFIDDVFVAAILFIATWWILA